MDHVTNRQTAFRKIESLGQRFVNHGTTPLDLTQAKMLHHLINQAWRKVEDEHASAVEACLDDAGIRVQVAVFEPMFESYVNLELRACTIIRDLEVAAAASAPVATPVTSNIRLPAMELPTFDGDLNEWRAFKDLFQATVGASTVHSGAQKLQYLKSSLKGKAADQIATLSTTDAHYPEAWKILCEKYENTREIVHSLIRKILDYKAVKSESANDLQSLLDNTLKCLRSLKVLGRPTSEWDDLIIVILVSKLDSSTRREWAIRQTGTTLPTLKELEDFLTGHIRGLLALGSNLQHKQPETRPVRFEKHIKVHHTAADPASCPVCHKPHQIYSCKQFTSMPPAERSSLARRNRLCYNCLSSTHQSKECPSSGTCRQCGSRHHTLLHVQRNFGTSGDNGDQSRRSTANSTQVANQKQASSQPPTVGTHHVSADDSGVLMTAVVKIADRHGRPQPCRIFMDNGSQADLITEDCARRLGLQRQSCSIGVGGIGGVSAGRTKGKVLVRLTSTYNKEAYLDVQLLVLERLTDLLPSVKHSSKRWNHLQGLTLADPEWHDPAPVDIILGVKHEPYIRLDHKILGSHPGEPTAWETIFGWAISGACPVERNTVTSFHVTIDLVDTFLRKFWETEEPPKAKILTADEKTCEKHFQDTHRRDADGRFVVQIPFNARKKELGASRHIAISRFRQVERRLSRHPELKKQYIDFMKEYIDLGHMTKVPPANPIPEQSLYLCHHGVTNQSSSTTKLRVVFDGSAETSSGLSLNDCMYVGATLQDDLFDILLRFRIHNVVLKGDIAKMFRQFRLEEADSEYHRIIWRENPEHQLEDYRLRTVTYGTACAPNLATRCLQQLAKDVEHEYPHGSRVLMTDAYVDDVLTGASTTEDAIALYKELTGAVSTAGMELRKWSTNNPEVLAAIPVELRETSPLDLTDDTLIKALGVQWHPIQDVFKFKEVTFQHTGELTKRKLYSDLARVFDPLGFVSCVTVRGKLLLQQLWSLSIDWDERVPDDIQLLWEEYKEDLKRLTDIFIPRQLRLSPTRIELHCFCDSSEKAYGSVLYIRCIFNDGTVHISFVTSKTRVAPMKQVNLPRLELNAAKLGAELTVHSKEVLSFPMDIFMWSDSTITLAWIEGEPRRWKTYVANRVAAIQQMTPKDSWRHVPGVENPADLASRGVSLSDLGEGEFWWKGPTWLSLPILPCFTAPGVPDDVDKEEKQATVVCHPTIMDVDWITRKSSLPSLKRVAAYIYLFISNCRTKQRTSGAGTDTESTESKPGPLTKLSPVSLCTSDLANGFTLLVKLTQQQYFFDDFNRLTGRKEVRHNSNLKKLHPFIDGDGVMRISGRLKKSSLDESRKLLIILPGEGHLVKLMVLQCHHDYHHAGFQFTWSQLGFQFWIVRGRDRVRHLLRSCVVCRRHRAKAAEQLMGQLPTCRVSPSRAFLHTGVDYAGPFAVKSQAGRGWKTSKSWMCLFVCMSSKAVHLELVESLSTESFLAALRRFSSRRGVPAHIYSDNGTNFVGAEKELMEYLAEPDVHSTLSRRLGDDGISWHFLPPSAPHQGGLWEAGVKSAKYHIRRVVGALILTRDQFSTLLCEVEAILNSRPLYQRSPDPADLEPLTPGHLLTGEPITAIPSPYLLHIPQNRLSQYQLVVSRVQDFWRRWSKEYLNTLQQRNKWMWEKENVREGDLVLLMEECPPATWKMGRIISLHPGDDGLVRNVTIQTANSKFKRPIVKIIPLLNCD